MAESPVNLECRVQDIIELGTHGGAGHLIICEVTLISVSESVMTEQRLDPNKLDLMGRLGRNYYVRASGAALMEIYQSVTDIPVGFDGLPESIRTSKILTGNQLAALASQTSMPTMEDIQQFKNEYKEWMTASTEQNQLNAATLIDEGKVWQAFCLLSAMENQPL